MICGGGDPSLRLKSGSGRDDAGRGICLFAALVEAMQRWASARHFTQRRAQCRIVKPSPA
jgi:hypothetical protein